jgi:hypothetical protein
MATQWGNNSLASGAAAGWSFTRPTAAGFLPVLSVMPLSASFTDDLWNGGGNNYPYFNELGISTTWSQLSLSDDGSSSLVYFLVVSNNSNRAISYAFLEADL